MDDFNSLFRQRVEDDSPVRLNHRSSSFRLRCFDPENVDNLFEHETQTIMQGDGPVTTERSDVFIGACGHLIGTTENMAIGICAICGQLLCSRPECTSYRCNGCNHLICKLCATEVEPGLVLCDPCRRSYRLKKFLKSGLLGIHHLLSREF